MYHKVGVIVFLSHSLPPFFLSLPIFLPPSCLLSPLLLSLIHTLLSYSLPPSSPCPLSLYPFFFSFVSLNIFKQWLTYMSLRLIARSKRVIVRSSISWIEFRIVCQNSHSQKKKSWIVIVTIRWPRFPYCIVLWIRKLIVLISCVVWHLK